MEQTCAILQPSSLSNAAISTLSHTQLSPPGQQEKKCRYLNMKHSQPKENKVSMSMTTAFGCLTN